MVPIAVSSHNMCPTLALTVTHCWALFQMGDFMSGLKFPGTQTTSTLLAFSAVAFTDVTAVGSVRSRIYSHSQMKFTLTYFLHHSFCSLCTTLKSSWRNSRYKEGVLRAGLKIRDCCKIVSHKLHLLVFDFVFKGSKIIATVAKISSHINAHNIHGSEAAAAIEGGRHWMCGTR
ncbi:hypothetical protein E2C01_012285 [Portunus trituberculatus]|uniref:Uncharacterized protein n=1 Tax=Portunus trituberculatus TaxID=210409 RepID=A0A5B7DD80_PORTR|nr:hypothetical protein [Portunus trituberculatus]